MTLTHPPNQRPRPEAVTVRPPGGSPGSAGDAAQNPSTPLTAIEVRIGVDASRARYGFATDSTYVEQFWLSVLGPTIHRRPPPLRPLPPPAPTAPSTRLTWRRRWAYPAWAEAVASPAPSSDSSASTPSSSTG